MTDRPALFACEAPPRAKVTNYPEPFAARVNGRLKRPLGDLFGLRNFGVNLTRLAPGAASSLADSEKCLPGEPTYRQAI